VNIEHTYNYTATYEDGTQINKDMNDPEGDKCLTRKDGTGSRFTDVQEKEKESKLISFVVHNNTSSFGVDLRDGHFEINGIPFFQHRPDLDGYKDFRIIYYRTVQRRMNQDGTELNGQVLSYTVGWQITHNGTNIQKYIVF
jgi:hypothetical protein